MIIQNNTMKASDLKSMSISDLQNKLAVIKNNYHKLKMQSRVFTIENPIRIKTIRRDIARIKTFITKNS